MLLYLKGVLMRFVFTLLIFVCLPALADNSLLEELSNKARNIERLDGLFVQNRQITVLPLPLISTGEFSYHHQTGMIWTTLEPIQSKVRITHHGIQTEIMGTPSAVAGSAQLATILLSIFSGNLASLTEQFYIQESGDITGWHLHLTPKNELVANQIAAIDIRGKEITESVAIADANGDSSKLMFTIQEQTLFDK